MNLANTTTTLVEDILSIEEPEQYIAVVRFKNSTEQTFDIDVTTDEVTFKDTVRVLKE